MKQHDTKWMIVSLFNNDNKNTATVKLKIDFYRGPVTSMTSFWLFIASTICFILLGLYNLHLFLKLKKLKTKQCTEETETGEETEKLITKD